MDLFSSLIQYKAEQIQDVLANTQGNFPNGAFLLLCDAPAFTPQTLGWKSKRKHGEEERGGIEQIII